MKSYLSLGSNEGNKEENLKNALEFLGESPGIEVVKVSSVYETEPWGGVEQPSYYNLAIEIETTLDPDELLQTCQEIENILGRKRRVRWGSRTIDIDILTYQQVNIRTDRLILPHPYMEIREFVLAPLREIAPNFLLSSGRSVKETRGEGEIKKIFII